VVKLFL